ncbi:transposase [Gallaecimonas kandeliae]|uniref:transposase n=1 Tax=Gallaecimonas kandeliae TaxID=3029055 RepID=UPI00264816FD|nr:transposase [Gallaecimonas kandeliae]WKE66657.1 transposase [Gallaecimonas kandeliae]
MPAYKTGKRTQQYSLEFKVKAVLWSHEPHRSVKDVAEALDIHPFMLSRWRKEFREGKYGMASKTPKPEGKLKEQDEVKQLKKRIAELEMENDILKKWQRFQAEERRNGIASSSGTKGKSR